MIVDMGLNNRHCKVLINMTYQKDIKSKTKSIVIPCWFMVWGTWRWSHCLKFHSRSSTWDVSDDLCVHEFVKCMLCALEHFVNVVPLPAGKSLCHSIKSRHDTSLSPSWLCAHAAIFITAYCKNVILLTPGQRLVLNQCTQIHSMAYGPTIIQYGKWLIPWKMNECGERCAWQNMAQIKQCTFCISNPNISPSCTQRQLTPSISNLFWMPSDSLSPPSQTTIFFLM